jgi:hypothetical protein
LLSLREIAAGWLVADAKRIALALDEEALREVTMTKQTTPSP